MTCPKCNYHGSDGDKWCPKCGAVLQEQSSVGLNSLEKAMKMHSQEVEKRSKTHTDVANLMTSKKIRKARSGLGIGFLGMSLLHFSGILWSFMRALFGEEGFEFFFREIAEGAYGEIGRMIVYNSGNTFLTCTEILMGIALIVVAIMSFCTTTQIMYYSTIPCTLFFTYLGYTIGLILSMDGGVKYMNATTHIGYIVVANIVTLMLFFNYMKTMDDWKYDLIKVAKGSASRPSANYAPIPSTPSANSAAQMTKVQNVAQTVKPTADRNTLKCSACGEGGQPLNRNCCWKCGAKFIK